MSSVDTVVVDFILDHIDKRLTQEPNQAQASPTTSFAASIFERLQSDALLYDDVSTQRGSTAATTNTASNSNNSQQQRRATTDKRQPIEEPVLEWLQLYSREFQNIIDLKRMTELTPPLMGRLRNGSKQRYYEAFKTVADEIFIEKISWPGIVTFLIYGAELAYKVMNLPTNNNQDDERKTYKMVLLVIKCVCRYFDERLLQWIDQQDGGWSSLLGELGAEFSPVPNACRGYKQYLGVAAFAMVIGGLYLCSKLTVQ